MPTSDPPRMSPLTLPPWHQTLSQTDGRDKLFRLLQYLFKLLRALDFGRTPPPPKTPSATIHALETALATSRQIWRLFKWMSVYAKSRPLPPSPPLPELTRVVGEAAMFSYYVCDNVTFLHKVGVLRGDIKVAARRAARFWLAAVVAGLVGGVYGIVECLRRERALGGGDEAAKKEVAELRRRRKVLMMTVVRLGGDFVLAGSLSGADLHPGVVGGCGVLSSLVGVWQIWPRVGG